MRRLVLLLALFLLPGLARAATATAIFAGGCFWCMEPPFDKTPGVLATTSGYTGGTVPDPTYRQVSAGGTGHVEAVEVTYDPARVSYDRLLQVFWRTIDPFDAAGQFCDKGSQYRAAIFVGSAAERQAAEASKAAIEARLGKPVVTAIQARARFWPAEDYHQDFYLKNAAKYRFYRLSCGRDARLKAVWGAQAAH